MQGWQRVSDLKKVDVASMQKLSARTKVSLLQQTGFLTIKNATQIDGEMPCTSSLVCPTLEF